MPEIEFKEGPLAGRRLTLESKTYSLGRRPDMDLPLDDVMISSEHAELRFQDGGWVRT
jgi:pSer/pThr/pTyr-binding forkhead associated (FHA) protein